jgi:hypothetical protein
MNYISIVCIKLDSLNIIEILNNINNNDNLLVLNIKKFNNIIHILIKNNSSINDENIVNLKWKLREKYNPKLKDTNLQTSKNLPPGISHNHIIHITDSNEECIEVCKFVLNKIPQEFENKIVNNIYIPWHLGIPKIMKKININIDKLYIRLTNDPNNYKIINSPHYKYVCNDRNAYINYYSKYMGIYLQDNHTPQEFDKLIANFNPNTYNLEGSRLILINNNLQVCDGLHRLSILKKNNIDNINVIMIQN